jgi:hypothetical protein
MRPSKKLSPEVCLVLSFSLVLCALAVGIQGCGDDSSSNAGDDVGLQLHLIPTPSLDCGTEPCVS